MPVITYAQLVRTKSANQPFSFFIQIAHLSARFRCQPCNDKLFSLQTTISILYLVRTHLQTRIKILHLVRTSLQTRDLQLIYILYFTLCCSIWISTKQCNFHQPCLTLLLKVPSSSLIQSYFKSSFQAKVTFIWSSPTSRSISPVLHPHRPGWPHQSRWHLKKRKEKQYKVTVQGCQPVIVARSPFRPTSRPTYSSIHSDLQLIQFCQITICFSKSQNRFIHKLVSFQSIIPGRSYLVFTSTCLNSSQNSFFHQKPFISNHPRLMNFLYFPWHSQASLSQARVTDFHFHLKISKHCLLFIFSGQGHIPKVFDIPSPFKNMQ